ncbi:MAG: hypothetical protein IT373_27440, partial [Polyangiaceae bacterium]|nr:hypothetical protein [Polyangiaceae bacterium]
MDVERPGDEPLRTDETGLPEVAPEGAPAGPVEVAPVARSHAIVVEAEASTAAWTRIFGL